MSSKAQTSSIIASCSLVTMLLGVSCDREPTSVPPREGAQNLEAAPVAAEPWAQPAPVERGGGYVFHTKSKRYGPVFFPLDSINGDPGPGDVVCFRDHTLILNEPGEYFLSPPEALHDRLVAVGPDGTRRPLSVALFTPPAEVQGRENGTSPGSISAEQLRQLWGVSVSEVGPGAKTLLRGIDPARTCVTVTDDAVLPLLPRELRCLAIVSEAELGDSKNWASLTRLTELRYFSYEVFHAKTFDARWIERSTKLRRVTIRSLADIRHPVALGALTELISLDMGMDRRVFNVGLAGQHGIDDIGGVAQMRSLRFLDLSGTRVRDLSPIAGAAALEEVRANATQVGILPSARVPALRRLQVLSTGLDAAKVSLFRESNEGCVVEHRWIDALINATKGATLIRVRSGGTCDDEGAPYKTIALREGAAAIRSFIELVEVNEAESRTQCHCCGSPTIEIYRGDRLVAALSVHGGTRLRWLEGWPSDAVLTARSSRALVAWLSELDPRLRSSWQSESGSPEGTLPGGSPAVIGGQRRGRGQ